MKPTSFTWCIKESLPFLFFSGLLFCITYFSHRSLDSKLLIGIICLLLMVILIFLEWLAFKIVLEPEQVKIHELFRKPFSLPYSQITQLFIRQSPFDKLFGIQTLIIEFADENLAQKIHIGSMYYPPRIPITGRYGNLILIPGLKNPTNLIELIQQHTSRPLNISKSIYGNPYQEKFSKFIYITSLILISLVLVPIVLYTLLYLSR